MLNVCVLVELLMNPLPDWTVRFFTKLGQRSLYIKLPGAVSAYRSSDGSRLDPELKLGEIGMLPYEMIEFRSDPVPEEDAN